MTIAFTLIPLEVEAPTESLDVVISSAEIHPSSVTLTLTLGLSLSIFLRVSFQTQKLLPPVI